MRVVRLQLGDEFIDFTEYLAAQGRRITVGTHSNGLAPDPASNCRNTLRRAMAVRFHGTSMPTM